VDAGREWSLETFGRPGPTIRKRIPELVNLEHNGCVGAQEEWGHEAQLAYGNFWYGIITRFHSAFSVIEGGGWMRPGHAPYRLPVVNGVTIFPWRFARSRETELEAVPFATSPTREAIPELRQRFVQDVISPEFSTPLELDEDDLKLLETLQAVQRDESTSNRLVVVGIASSVSGIHSVRWGEVALASSGYVKEIGHWESLLTSTATKPTSMDLGRTFAEGDQPSRRVEIRRDDAEPQADE